MRIDYREPRQYGSGTTGQTPQRKTGRSSSSTMAMVLLLLSVGFGLGFATGWHFSQKSAKKAFRAAMEQQSLESLAKQTQTAPGAPSETTPPTAGQQQTAAQPANAAHDPKVHGPAPASPAAPVPLSFFDNLPRGQKQTVLGSGINEKPKPVPPPAAIPQPVSKQVTQPVTPAPAAPKPAAVPPSASGFVVQVASFNNRKEAEATRTKLAAKGYSATLSEVELNDKGTWYRVRIGRHLEREAAAEIATKIGGGAKVVPDQE